MGTSAVVVFTGKSLKTIMRQGGSSSWTLDPSRARQCEYLVCTRNSRRFEANEKHLERHGSAFLVGRVSGAVLHRRHNGAGWLITISEFALINVPDVWRGWRNPVKYATLEELEIDPASLEFKPMPSASAEPELGDEEDEADEQPVLPKEADDERPLTIAQAKIRLAKVFGVQPDAVEITIRG